MQTKVIKEKIKSVGNIKKITKTMEMVSAAKMKKAIDGALTLRPFHVEAQHILADISLDSLVQHELLAPNHVEEELVILIASNKGLCGSYNVNVYRSLIASYDDYKKKKIRMITVGKFAEKVAKKMHCEVLASFNHPVLTARDARVITKMIIEQYKSHHVGNVRLLYTHFTTATSFTPTLIQLLPFESEGEPDTHGEPRYAYEPDQDVVLDQIIPMMLHNIIYGGLLESYASEHSARMFAMKNATDNADELQKDLKLYFNRARQSAVTQEIAEITSGAMALTT
jgi:F-type H+-transporting ATPase subunit gamma